MRNFAAQDGRGGSKFSPAARSLRVAATPPALDAAPLRSTLTFVRGACAGAPRHFVVSVPWCGTSGFVPAASGVCHWVGSGAYRAVASGFSRTAATARLRVLGVSAPRPHPHAPLSPPRLPYGIRLPPLRLRACGARFAPLPHALPGGFGSSSIFNPVPPAVFARARFASSVRSLRSVRVVHFYMPFWYIAVKKSTF